MRASRAALRATAALALLHAGLAVGPSGAAPEGSPWGAGYFPNVPLVTQDGEVVHFYDDLIRGRLVVIDFIFTSCSAICPAETARLRQVYELLGDRMGRDVFFYSISIDPERDTPAALKAFAEKYHAGPGWTFLTGKREDIDLISKKLGLYSAPDPENKDGHMPALLIGNEATGQWIRGSALDNPKMTATMIANWVAGYPAAAPIKSYADAPPLPKYTSGQYLFSTKCSACHTLGSGSKVGPDLSGITHTRDRQWLARYIAGPDDLLKAGDPLAKSLLAKYKDLRMPNLQLNGQQVADVIAYLDGR